MARCTERRTHVVRLRSSVGVWLGVGRPARGDDGRQRAHNPWRRPERRVDKVAVEAAARVHRLPAAHAGAVILIRDEREDGHGGRVEPAPQGGVDAGRHPQRRIVQHEPLQARDLLLLCVGRRARGRRHRRREQCRRPAVRVPSEEDTRRPEAEAERVGTCGHGEQLARAPGELLARAQLPRREGQRCAVLEPRRRRGAVRVLDARDDHAVGRKGAHQVRGHVHVAAEAVRVHQQRRVALERRRVEKHARASRSQVRQEERGAHLPEAHETRHAVRRLATVGAVRRWRSIRARCRGVEYLHARTANSGVPTADERVLAQKPRQARLTDDRHGRTRSNDAGARCDADHAAQQRRT